MASDEPTERGVIIHYDRKKKFGFIKPYAEGRTSIFFHRSILKDDWEPSENDHVRFIQERTKRGIAARYLEYIRDDDGEIENKPWPKLPGRAKSRANTDQREKCKFCSKKMTPRTKFKDGKVEYLYCPYCSAVHSRPGFWVGVWNALN